MLELVLGGAIGSAAFNFAIMMFLFAGLRKLRVARGRRLPTVSVIVAARNEEQKLKACLDALTAQTYPRKLTEIIVVDDRSSDRTAQIIQEYASRFPDLISFQRIEMLPEGRPAKKFALSSGIGKARGEIIFTTDADCAPLPGWISETTAHFGNDVGLVIGAAPLDVNGSLLNRLLCHENLARELVAAGSAGWNVGVTCTGRNLAYRKPVFEELGGFARIDHSLSGDDDLFLQLVRSRTDWKITHSLSATCAVSSPSVTSFADFARQFRRHISAGKYYRPGIKAAYLLYNISNLYLFAFLIFGFFVQEHLELATFLFAFKVMLDVIALSGIARKLNRLHLLIWLPAWELFYLFNQVVLAPWAFVGKIRWK